MKKSQLRKIILEELKGYSKYAPGGETKGGTSDEFRNILTKIAKQELDEEDSDVKKVEIVYTSPSGKFRYVKVDGKQLPEEKAKEFIKNHTGKDLPDNNGFPNYEKVLDIVKALKAKGIDASEWEMDVS
jgi:hypothetical protein